MRAAWHLCSLDFDAWARMDGTKSVLDSVHWQPNGCPRFPLSCVSCLVQLVLSCWKDLTGFVFSCSAQWEHTVTVETLLLCWHVENLQVSVLGKRLIGGSLQSKKKREAKNLCDSSLVYSHHLTMELAECDPNTKNSEHKRTIQGTINAWKCWVCSFYFWIIV